MKTPGLMYKSGRKTHICLTGHRIYLEALKQQKSLNHIESLLGGLLRGFCGFLDIFQAHTLAYYTLKMSSPGDKFSSC